MYAYVVQPGDYLSKIAPVYGESWQKLYADNRAVVGNDPNVIFPGQVLKVGGRTVTVKGGSWKPSSPSRSNASPRRSSAPSSGGSRSTSSPRAAAVAIFGSQFQCAANIISRESGWSVTAENPDGAYGLPQAYPAWKMASAGADWRTNPLTQLRWMRAYVDERYGGVCAAWSYWEGHSAY